MPSLPSTPETPVSAHTRLTATFSTGLTLPLAFRTAQLRALRTFLHKEEAAYFAALRADLHKPPLESLTYDQFAVCYDIANLLHTLPRLVRPKKASREMGAPVHIEPTPKGLVLIFGPFNFPVLLLLRPLVAAIAAGNVVCVKPSENAPACEAFLLRLRDVLDPRAFAILTGGPDVAGALLELRWDHIMFTGSSNVGRIVMTAAAKHLTPVTLELGGKSPAIVTKSAHIPTAVTSIARSRFLNCGQICIASDYCLVDDSIYDDFIPALIAKVREFYTADPKNCSYYGRLISSRHLERVTALLKNTSGRILLGGDYDDADQHYVAPTVVAINSGDDALMKEEIFGPVLPILRVTSTDEAVSFVNARDKPLALYLFSRDRDETKNVIARTRSGSAAVNETMMEVAVKGSFIGGVGESGMGAYGFSEGFHAFSHSRPVMYSSPFWARVLSILNPNRLLTKDGKENKNLERLMRVLGRIPFPNSGGIPVQEKASDFFRILSGAAAAVVITIIGLRIANKNAEGD